MPENSPTISVQVVTWNGMRHLPTCFRSIEEQTRPADQLLVIDNYSIDGTLDWIRDNAPRAYILRQNRNTGFAHGHNQGFRLTKTKYILCLNQDVILDKEWLERATEIMEKNPQLGMLGGRIMRYDYDDHELTGVVISDIVDSAGLRIDRARHVIDRESGWKMDRHRAESGLVFGLSGACIMFRTAALNAVRYGDEYFDEDFFSYKEDIDLAWRLQRAGWSAWYQDDLLAFHHRTIRGEAMSASLRMAKYYWQREKMNARFSYRNHLLMLIKNETPTTFWPDSPWIIWYETGKFIFLLFTRPRTLSVWREVLRLIPSMKRKARLIEEKSKVPAKEIRMWFLKTA